VAADPPVTPLTCQVTATFVLPVTVDVNCAVELAWTLAEVGETVIETAGGAEVEPTDEDPPQPDTSMKKRPMRRSLTIRPVMPAPRPDIEWWLISALYRRLMRSQHIAILYRWQAIFVIGWARGFECSGWSENGVRSICLNILV
jgi:hypothetical protein